MRAVAPGRAWRGHGLPALAAFFPLRRSRCRPPNPTEDQPEPDAADGRQPGWSWLLAAAAGAFVTALAGWVLVAGMAVVGWVTSDPGTLGDALGVGTELWLLGQRRWQSRCGGLSLTLVPLGLVAIIAFLISRCAGVRGPAPVAGEFRRRLVRAQHGGGDDGGLPGSDDGHRPAARAPVAAVRAAAVMSPVVALAAAFGAGRALDYRLTDRWPAWARVAAAGGARRPSWCCWRPGPRRGHRRRPAPRPGRTAGARRLDPGLAGNIALLLAAAGLRARTSSSGPAALHPRRRIQPRHRLGGRPDRHRTGRAAGGAAASAPCPPRRRAGAASNCGGWPAGCSPAASPPGRRARPPAGRAGETSLVGGLAGRARRELVFIGLAWASGGALGADRLADARPDADAAAGAGVTHPRPGRHGRRAGPRAAGSPGGRPPAPAVERAEVHERAPPPTPPSSRVRAGRGASEPSERRRLTAGTDWC